jgi:hypothetical protein
MLKKRGGAPVAGAAAPAAPASAPAAAPAAAGGLDPNEPGISPKEKARRAMLAKRGGAAPAAVPAAAPAAAPAPAAAAAPPPAPAAAPTPVEEDLDPDEEGISPKEKARRTMLRKRKGKA